MPKHRDTANLEESKSWHSWITDADKTDDVTELRRIVTAVARELFEAEQRIDHLERAARGAEGVAERAQQQIRQAAAIRAAVQAEALKEFRKLMPSAIAQAKKGKPALLRMILRATK